MVKINFAKQNLNPLNSLTFLMVKILCEAKSHLSYMVKKLINKFFLKPTTQSQPYSPMILKLFFER